MSTTTVTTREARAPGEVVVTVKKSRKAQAQEPKVVKEPEVVKAAERLPSARAAKATERMPFTVQAVPLNKIRVSDRAQRALRPARVAELLEGFDPDLMDYPVMNLRHDGYYYNVDGQHRVEAVKQWLGDWEGQSIDCRVYVGLSERQEAHLFRELNNKLTVSAIDNYRVGVVAGYVEETAISRVLAKLGIKVSLTRNIGEETGNTYAIGTLMSLYRRSDITTLERTLTIAQSAFGDPGLISTVIGGLGHVVQRYDAVLDDADVVERLSVLRGGVGALMSRAQVIRKTTGKPLAQCVASVVVDIVNTGKGPRSSKRLPNWWSLEAEVGDEA